MLMLLMGGGGGRDASKPVSGGQGQVSLSGLPLGPLGEGLAGGGSAQGLAGGAGGSISQGLGLNELNQGLDEAGAAGSLMSLLGSLGDPSQFLGGGPTGGGQMPLGPGEEPGGNAGLPMQNFGAGGAVGQQGTFPSPVAGSAGGGAVGGIGTILAALGLGRNLLGTSQGALGSGSAFQLPGIPADLGYSSWGPPGLYNPAAQYGFSGEIPPNLDPFNAGNYQGALIDPNLDLTGIAEGGAAGGAAGQGITGSGLGAASTAGGGGGLVQRGITSLLGEELGGQVGSYLPYLGPLIGLGVGLGTGQDTGQVALNTAINVAGAALAPETMGLSMLAAPLITMALGTLMGPSENWMRFGGKVGKTLAGEQEGVGQLLQGILGSQSQEQLQAARDAYVRSFGQRLNPTDPSQLQYTEDETTGGQVPTNAYTMGNIPIEAGQYLPFLAGATGTPHEGGRRFNPNALNVLLNNLYANRLTAFTQPSQPQGAAMGYLNSILPMIQMAMGGAGGNIEDFLGGGALPELFANLTPA